jgi:hypothetical protein
VLTNFIQADATSSGPPTRSALPFPSAGPGPNNFASTLQSAGAPAPATPQPEPATVAGRGKSAEKKTADNSKTTASGQLTPAIGPAVIGHATSPPVIAVNLETKPPLPPDITGSIATVGSIPPLALSSRSDATTGLATGADSAKQPAAVGLAGEFQKDTPTHNSAAVLDSAASVAALDAGKQTPVGGFASPPNVAAVVKQVIPLPVGEARPPLPPLNESEAGQRAAAPNGVAGPSVASQESAGTLPSASAGLDPPAQKISPPTAEFAGIASNGDPRPVPATPTQSGMPLPAMDPTSSTANAAAGVNPSAPDSNPQPSNGDLRSLPPTPTQSGMPLHAVDPTSGTANAAAGVNPSAPGSKPQPGDGDPRPVPATPPPIGKPLQAMDPTNSPTNGVTGVNQSASDSKPQSGNGSGQESLDALPSSLTVSSAASSAEISKPILLPAAMAMKSVETMPAADARTKGTPTVQVPSSQEGTRSKPADSSSNPADANAQPISPNAAPASPTGQANSGDQPGSAAANANVLTQVPPAANQDSGSRSAPSPSPAAEPQSPAANSPTPLPAVGPVEVARLVAGMAQSEMYIGLRTQAFGSVEVHTVVRDSQVGLTVGSERGDLRTLLSTEVPGLQTTFRQQDLRFDSIRFLETSAGTTAGFSGGADSQPRSSSQQHSSPAGLFSIHSPPEDPVELDIGAGLRARLNVHA